MDFSLEPEKNCLELHVKKMTSEKKQASGLETFMYTQICTLPAVEFNTFMTAAQLSNFLFVFSAIIGSSKCHDWIKKKYIATPTHAMPKSVAIFLLWYSAKHRAAEKFIFWSEALPGRVDEKQTVRCRLGMVWMTVRDWKWHIHRWMNVGGSQLLLHLVKAGRDIRWPASHEIFLLFFIFYLFVCYSVPHKSIWCPWY